MKKLVIGFIGQGYIGKNYADDFENRGYEVIRYSLEEKFKKNREKIKECDIIFIAVPTPTTPRGFDDRAVREAIKLVGRGKIAVIKSTVWLGFTEKIQRENPKIFVFHSPEFLVARTASYDAAHPIRNIIGTPKKTTAYQKKAKEIMKILPKAPFELICSSEEAEIIKYGGNNLLYFKIVFTNLLYDLTQSLGADWGIIKSALSADPRLGKTHFDPVFEGGRGAGGLCFIKDFSTFKSLYDKKVGDKYGRSLLQELENKNIDLLLKSGKSLDFLFEVYGKSVLKRNKK